MNTSEQGSDELRAGHNRFRRSIEMFEEARKVFPGGVTRAPVERFAFPGSSQRFPVYLESGQGAWLTDVDGNRYLDLVNNYSTLIHGHSFAPIVEALQQQLHRGTCFSGPTESDYCLGKIICERVPSVEETRFVNTGTEAVMFAVKAARAYTGRTKVAKFEGAYHGVYDWVESSLGVSPANWGEPHPVALPNYKGTPSSVLDEVVVVPFNDIDATARVIKRHADELACFVIDPMPTRAGTIGLEPDYIRAIQELTSENGILLLSDEIYNFRLDYHGAASRFGYTPDLCTFGKIIGGGLPIGAIAGARDIMAVFDNSSGPPQMPQGGTFTANPMSMVAGIASMNALPPAAFEHLESLGKRLRSGLNAVVAENALAMQVTGEGSLFELHVKAHRPRTYREFYPTADEKAFLDRLRVWMMLNGVMATANFGGCVSTVMTNDDIDFFVGKFEQFVLESDDLPRVGA